MLINDAKVRIKSQMRRRKKHVSDSFSEKSCK